MVDGKRGRRMAAAILVAGVGLVGCAGPGPSENQRSLDEATALNATSSNEPADTDGGDDVVAGVVDLLQNEGVTRICFMWMESAPPQCYHGAVVEGDIDWNALDAPADLGVHAAPEVWVKGRYADGVLTLHEATKEAPAGRTSASPTPTPIASASVEDLRKAQSAVLDQFSGRFSSGLIRPQLEWTNAEMDEGWLDVRLIASDPELVRQIQDAAAEHIPVDAIRFLPLLTPVEGE